MLISLKRDFSTLKLFTRLRRFSLRDTDRTKYLKYSFLMLLLQH